MVLITSRPWYLEQAERYDPHEKRDKAGRWSKGSGGGLPSFVAPSRQTEHEKVRESVIAGTKPKPFAEQSEYERAFRANIGGGFNGNERLSRSRLSALRRAYKADLPRARGKEREGIQGGIDGMQHELDARRSSGRSKIDDRVKMKIAKGADSYQWRVEVDGKVVANGLTKSEAEYERHRHVKRLGGVTPA